jgi:hypothetical protein
MLESGVRAILEEVSTTLSLELGALKTAVS